MIERALSESDAVRFWPKVAKGPGADDCWIWTASKVKDGYGGFRQGKLAGRLAHRISYITANGPIPAGLHVLHRCDTPACVNPAHLFLGTHQDNVADKLAKGRQARGTTSGRAKLSDDQVREIRALRELGHTYESIARLFGITWSGARLVALRLSWRHVA
jgi:Pectobacterium phage endonuclease